MYIYKTKYNKYCIRKWVKGDEKEYYGTYPSIHEAQQKLETLIQQGTIQPPQKDSMRYISQRGKKYRLRKVINGKEYHKTYNTLEEAIHARDNMIKVLTKEKICRKPVNRTRYTGIQYVYQVPTGKYVLQRRGVHYGTYRTVIDAVKDKLFWEDIDWNMDNLDNY